MNATTPIVVIDDNRHWRDTLTDLLQDRGFHVLSARDGREGLALVQSSGAGLVILDFHMPEVNGLELLSQLRSCKYPLHVILLSSENDPTLPVRALACGARAFLSKTMAPALLVRALLDAARAAIHNRGSESSQDRRHFLPVLQRRVHYLPVPRVLFDRRWN
jgi:DNA-binding response OmpR family regulator